MNELERIADLLFKLEIISYYFFLFTVLLLEDILAYIHA